MREYLPFLYIISDSKYLIRALPSDDSQVQSLIVDKCDFTDTKSNYGGVCLCFATMVINSHLYAHIFVLRYL